MSTPKVCRIWGSMLVQALFSYKLTPLSGLAVLQDWLFCCGPAAIA